MVDSCNSGSDTVFDEEEEDKRIAEAYMNTVAFQGPSFKHFIPRDKIDPAFFMLEDETRDEYRKLFLSSSGSILVTAASPGELAVRHPICGGDFTRKFLEALRDATHYKSANWEAILAATKLKISLEREKNFASDGFASQTVQYELGLNSSSISLSK